IQPVFGHRKVTSIKSYEIQKLWTDKLETHSTSTINRMHTILNKIYKQFIKWEEIKHNPMNNVEKPRVRYGKTEVWSKEEVNRFLIHAKDFQSYIVFYLAIHTGMRLGEVLALHWSDLDFDNQVIYVSESLDRKIKKRGPLKTESSKRVVSMTDSQMNVLRKHKEIQDPKSEIVCSTSIGTYFNPSNIRRAMSSICKQAEIKKIRFHDLRHTHATLLIEAEVPAKAVQERLGHADVRITLERYTHLSDRTHIETAKRFQALLNENS
ncbi:MAG TPA: site-specific integrase, partial [Atopostipes sp.]|nr:site-specific integrase [Atopostipes sp.]